MAVTRTGCIARKNVRITFQKNEAYSDKYKNRLQQWTDCFSCSAYAGTYAAEERGNEVITEERTIIFECRWCPELECVSATGYRILFNGDRYDILSVDHMNYQRQAIRFTCRREKR